MATFTPPVAANGPRVLPSTRGAARALWRHYSARPVGQSVLKTGGVYVTKQTPTTTECAAADIVYLGGHVYTVDATEAAALTAAGYGTYLS